MSGRVRRCRDGAKLPPMESSSDCQEAGNSGESRHLPGDAADTGNQSAASRHAEICSRGAAPRKHQTTGNVYVQTIETSVLNAMNSRTMEILADWKPTILDGKVTAISGAAPKRRSVKVDRQLDQLGPSTEGREVVSA